MRTPVKLNSTRNFAQFGGLRLCARRATPLFALSALAGVSLIACLPRTAPAQTLAELRAARKAAYNPRAIELLGQMADAYAHLTELDQKTEFYSMQMPLAAQGTGGRSQGSGEEPSSAGIRHKAVDGLDQGITPRPPADRPMGRTVRLMLDAPNLLRLETTETSGAGEPAKTAVSICDGKIFWTYNPEKNWYTKEKAPKNLPAFQKLTLTNNTLELMMLTGMNPFADVENQFDAVKYEGVQDIYGMAVEVVTLRAESEQQTQELRFYIGRQDLLLHRLVVESTPVVHAVAPPKRDPLDDLVASPVPMPPAGQAGNPNFEVAPGFEDPNPLPPPGVPMKTRITCENRITYSPRFDDKTFRFEPPAGAALYNSVNGSGDFSRLSNSLSMQELLQKARNGKSAKKARPVRMKP